MKHVGEFFPKLKFRDHCGYAVEWVADFLIKLSVKIRNPRCRCEICTRNFGAILERACEYEMQLWYERDKGKLSGNLCVGESR